MPRNARCARCALPGAEDGGREGRRRTEPGTRTETERCHRAPEDRRASGGKSARGMPDSSSQGPWFARVELAAPESAARRRGARLRSPSRARRVGGRHGDEAGEEENTAHLTTPPEPGAGGAGGGGAVLPRPSASPATRPRASDRSRSRAHSWAWCCRPFGASSCHPPPDTPGGACAPATGAYRGRGRGRHNTTTETSNERMENVTQLVFEYIWEEHTAIVRTTAHRAWERLPLAAIALSKLGDAFDWGHHAARARTQAPWVVLTCRRASPHTRIPRPAFAKREASPRAPRCWASGSRARCAVPDGGWETTSSHSRSRS